MQIEYLHYFICVADLGNVTHAAERLSISQPQLSRILTSLERDVGVKLLERNAKGAALTESGRVFYRTSKKILESCEEGVRLAREASDETTTHFVLGSTIDFYLPGFVKFLLEKIPGSAVKQVYGQRGDLGERLLSQNIGSVITAPLLDVSPRLQTEVLFQDKLVVIHPHGHAFSDRGSVSISEVDEQRIVLHTPGYGIRPVLDLAMNAAGLGWRNLVVETGETNAIVDFVRSGIGIGVLPAEFAQADEFCAGHMVPFDRDIPLPIAVSWLRDRALLPIHYRYKEVLVEYFSLLGKSRAN